MTEQERVKYAYSLMVKNNPDEAVKTLIRFDNNLRNIGNVAGVSIMVNPETYEDIKKRKTIYENEILTELQLRIDKAIKYMRSQYTITDDDLYLALYSSDGTLDKLENILRGEDNDN